MELTIKLNDDEVARLRSLTHTDDNAIAVAAAAREYLRLGELRQLKAASGRVDFSLDWEELERLELEELDKPTR